MNTRYQSNVCVTVTTVLVVMLIGTVCSQDATVTYRVREEREADTYIGSVALDSELFTDITNEKFKRLQFQILKEGNQDVNYFKIEKETSFLWTRSRIDREEFADCFETCTIEFNVAVFDLDLSDITKVIQIVIILEDYNDHAPEFIHIDSPLSISESTNVGDLLVSGAAIDLDQGAENSLKTYTLLPQTDVFELKTVQLDDNAKEFELYLKNRLDHEKVRSYDLVIIAKDGGSPQETGTLSLQIIVTDDNDNVPVFDEVLYNTTIGENLDYNTTVLVISASDDDAGENGRVSYKLGNRVSQNILNVFSIGESTGELVTIGNVDFETDEEFSFEVIAYDHGDPPKSSSAEIYISVNDLNDNAPIINVNQPPGGTMMSENADIGSYITHLEVIDLDSGKNGQVTCSVLDNLFKLETVTGIGNNYKIVLNQSLDHETKASHNVTVRCTDMAQEPQTTLAHFIVHVEDVNDNAPEFNELVYSVTIDENNAVGVFIVKVSAVDKDGVNNSKVSYSLHTDSDGLFRINTLSGIITANASLDRETLGDQVIFRVLATDNGEEAKTSTGTVVVNLNDLNDNAPIFTSDPIVLNVTENQRTGVEVGNVTASDPDYGLNGTFYWKFPEDPDVLEYFNFHDSGQITTNKMLDREHIAYHEFYVHAVDMGGRTSSALVVIQVGDMNDNYPEILYPNDYDGLINVEYNLPVPSEVLRVKARDFDTGENSKLHYYIDQHNASFAFVLNTNSGRLFLNQSLDESHIGQLFHFDIRVTDGGTTPLSSWSELGMRIIRGNTSPVVQQAGSQYLWIVVGIVLVTMVLSVIMIIIIVKICWYNRRKDGSTGSAVDMIDPNELDKQFIDTSSDTSTSSKDSNSNVKMKNGGLQDGYPQKGYYSNLDETGDYLGNLSMDNHNMYMQHIQKLDIQRKLDETTSDNSGELGTRDSGQGGSDLDNISLTELSHPHTTDSLHTTAAPSSQTHDLHHYHRNRPPSLPSNSYHSNRDSDNISDNTVTPKCVASFNQVPAKTAERKELMKLRKSQKRVMFSDELENSQSSGRSSSMSSQSYMDMNHADPNHSSSRRFSRMCSEDSGVGSLNRASRANDWLRRSADNLTWQQNSPKIYNQLPSNQIKFGNSGNSSGNSTSDNDNKPMGNNIKSYLDRVMSRSRQRSLSETQSDTLRSDGSNEVFTVSGHANTHPHTSVRTHMSDGTNEVFTVSGPANTHPHTSVRTDSTTTSGSYYLSPRTLSLTTPSMGSDDLFGEDFEI